MDYREKRLSPRRNTTIFAALVYDAGQTWIECIIRDLSDGGAKLEVASVKNLPTSFDLMVSGHRPQSCRVAWRALREVGVQFVAA